MEAATPLPFSQIRVIGDAVRIDGLVVRDETVVRLVSDHEQPDRLVADAIEIGARVLDRESTGANAEFVKTEFERAARELDNAFVERARIVAERMDAKVDEVFGAENGHVTKALERHFGDDSSVAVQNRVRAVVGEAMQRSREDLLKQFSSADGSNPLADFKSASMAAMRQASDRQAEALTLMSTRLEAMKLELTELRAERRRVEEVEAEREKGTAKGRTYEEAVFEAIDAVAVARGDDCDATGDFRGEGGRKGDVIVDLDACAGPGRGRIVFEAKAGRLSKNEALAYLDTSMATRSANYAILVVPSDDKLPAKTSPLREFGGNKLFVTFDPEEGSKLALEVAYGLARARVLMAREDGAELDITAIRSEVERAEHAMEAVRKIKSQLTNATTGIENARELVDTLAATVRAHLAEVDALLRPAGDGA